MSVGRTVWRAEPAIEDFSVGDAHDRLPLPSHYSRRAMRSSDIILALAKELVAVSVEALPGNVPTSPELMPSNTGWLSGLELVAHEERASLTPQSLWVRRSVITVTGFAFSLYEVFLPAIGERPFPRGLP